MKQVFEAIVLMSFGFLSVLWLSSPLGYAWQNLHRHGWSFRRALDAARSPEGSRVRYAVRWGGVLPVLGFGMVGLGASKLTFAYSLVAGTFVGFLVWSDLTRTAMEIEHAAATRTEPDE